jgi:hypothetical protein
VRLRVRWTVTSSAIEVKNNYFEVNMTAATDTDIREIRTAVESIAKATESNTKAIAVCFSNSRTRKRATKAVARTKEETGN